MLSFIRQLLKYADSFWGYAQIADDAFLRMFVQVKNGLVGVDFDEF